MSFTRTPYYTIVIDTPTYSPSFIIGQDSDNGWDVVSRGAFQDSILTAITLAGKSVWVVDSVGIRSDLDLDVDGSLLGGNNFIITSGGSGWLTYNNGIEAATMKAGTISLTLGLGAAILQSLSVVIGDNSDLGNGAFLSVADTDGKIVLNSDSVGVRGDLGVDGEVNFINISADSSGLNTGDLWFNSTTGAIHRKF